MSESTQAPTQRPDVDILADLDEITLAYPPLSNDRFHLNMTVNNGAVSVSGYVKTMNTRSYLLRTLGLIEGITSVDTEYLFVDDLMRLDVGRAVPVGISVWAEYGTVVLSGRLPHGAVPADVAARVGAVPGVVKVVTSFYE
jgi:hypothetical protein